MNTRYAASSYRSWAAAVVILVTLVCGGIVPGSKLDRWVFRWMAGVTHDPPMWVDGIGSHEAPWSLRAPTAETVDLTNHLPLMIGVGDDPEGVFQTSPPSPVDYAVMFSNLKRLGVEKAACGVVLEWEEPDAIGLVALERALGGFESMVMCAPVSRGTVEQPLPQAFRRASLPLTAVIGDAAQLPVVNRIPVPDVLLGSERTWAGFTTVESEPDGGHPFLCARWDDRVVFSFALCVVARRLGLPLDEIEIRLGEYVRIGREGPIVPIDSSGRMRAVAAQMTGEEKPAEGLIDAQDGWLPRDRAEPVILADRRSMADDEVRRFSLHVSGLVAAIAGEAGLSAPHAFRRLPGVVEWLLVEAVAFGLAAMFWLRRSESAVALAMLGMLLVAIQFAAFAGAGLWVPAEALWVPLCVTAVGLWWPLRRKAFLRIKLALRGRYTDTLSREANR